MRLAELIVIIVVGTTLGCTGCEDTANTTNTNLDGKADTVEVIEAFHVPESQKFDMLWVVDDSNSMCEEQKSLRQNFEDFINTLAETNYDFHIGVTTTNMDSRASAAIGGPGLLQSTPQPVVSTQRPSCYLAVDDQGQLIAGDYTPVREAIAAAVACTQTRETTRFEWTDEEIECGVLGTPAGCEILSAGCGGSNAPCKADDLFPDEGEYRPLPLVFRSTDYLLPGGKLDQERLVQDFVCATQVGTRGSEFEAGIMAAVEAVSPTNTGGFGDDAETSAPNHGLIREDATFILAFVTDENDCSHEGARSLPDFADTGRPVLNVNSACGSDICEIVNKEGYENSPLIPIADLKDQFLTNLAVSKGRVLGDTFPESEVLVASIHGNSHRYDGIIPTEEECSDQSFSPIPPTCASSLGLAHSGDRYERFLRAFPDGNYYPAPTVNNPDAGLLGWICVGDFSPVLQVLGGYLSGRPASCITRPVLPCAGPEDSASCPAFPYTNEAGTCTQVPNSENTDAGAKYYCNSGIQLRGRFAGSPNAEAQLQETGYCIEESIGDRTFPDGCVIRADKFTIDPCPSGLPGVKFLWNDDIEAKRVLAGMEIQLRYNSLTSQTAGIQ